MKFFDWNQKTFKHKVILVVVLLGAGMVAHEIFGRNGYLTLQHQKKEYSNLQQQIQTLSKNNQELEQKINALKNNPEAVEKQARDQLHLVKPGEFIYVLPNKKQASGQQASPRQSQPRQ